MSDRLLELVNHDSHPDRKHLLNELDHSCGWYFGRYGDNPNLNVLSRIIITAYCDVLRSPFRNDDASDADRTILWQFLTTEVLPPLTQVHWPSLHHSKLLGEMVAIVDSSAIGILQPA